MAAAESLTCSGHHPASEVEAVRMVLEILGARSPALSRELGQVPLPGLEMFRETASAVLISGPSQMQISPGSSPGRCMVRGSSYYRDEIGQKRTLHGEPPSRFGCSLGANSLERMDFLDNMDLKTA